MKKNILINLLFAQSILLLISCSESRKNVISPIDDISLFVSDYSSLDGAWDGDCPNETHDGDPEVDCYGQPSNCIVICGSSVLSPDYTDFQYNISINNSADYYENGNGQTFMPLKTLPYNDLINGLTKIIKVNASPHTYAIIDL